MLSLEHIDCFQLVFWGYAGEAGASRLPRFYLSPFCKNFDRTQLRIEHIVSSLKQSQLAQINWLYASPSSRHYRIGLYHGDKTRHVLLYINNRITVIDFGVKKDKSYSFFIENELCDLTLEKKEDHWAYNFKINTKALTPANVARRKREKRHMIYAIAFLILFVSLIVLTLQYIL